MEKEAIFLEVVPCFGGFVRKPEKAGYLAPILALTTLLFETVSLGKYL